MSVVVEENVPAFSFTFGIPPLDTLGDTVLIGTWNVRDFAGLTAAWQTGTRDSPKRNLARRR